MLPILRYCCLDAVRPDLACLHQVVIEWGRVVVDFAATVASDQTRMCRRGRCVTAVPPRADIVERDARGRFGPKPETSACHTGEVRRKMLAKIPPSQWAKAPFGSVRRTSLHFDRPCQSSRDRDPTCDSLARSPPANRVRSGQAFLRACFDAAAMLFNVRANRLDLHDARLPAGPHRAMHCVSASTN